MIYEYIDLKEVQQQLPRRYMSIFLIKCPLEA